MDGRGGEVGPSQEHARRPGAGYAKAAHRRAGDPGGRVRHQPGERGVAGRIPRRQVEFRHRGHRRTILVQERQGEALEGAAEGHLHSRIRVRTHGYARGERLPRPLAGDISVGPGESVSGARWASTAAHTSPPVRTKATWFSTGGSSAGRRSASTQSSPTSAYP
jgi:hypothetical protein